MKVIRYLCAIVLGSSVAFAEALAPNTPPPAPAAGDGWNLVWADEFDYTGLPDPAKCFKGGRPSRRAQISSRLY